MGQPSDIDWSPAPRSVALIEALLGRYISPLVS